MSVVQTSHKSYTRNDINDRPLLSQVQGSHARVAHVWLIYLIVEHGIQCKNGLLLVCGLSSVSHSRGKGMGPCISH